MSHSAVGALYIATSKMNFYALVKTREMSSQIWNQCSPTKHAVSL